MAIRCLVDLQRAAGGDGLIGRQLIRCWARAGFDAVAFRRGWCTWIRADRTRRWLHQEDVHRDDRGHREPALASGMVEPALFDAGIRDLYRTAESDGVFCYTFFKALGEKARHP